MHTHAATKLMSVERPCQLIGRFCSDRQRFTMNVAKQDGSNRTRMVLLPLQPTGLSAGVAGDPVIIDTGHYSWKVHERGSVGEAHSGRISCTPQLQRILDDVLAHAMRLLAGTEWVRFASVLP